MPDFGIGVKTIKRLNGKESNSESQSLDGLVIATISRYYSTHLPMYKMAAIS